MRMHNPPHPGELLRELWLEPLRLSLEDAAAGLRVPRETLADIVEGREALTPEMALRLEIAFGKGADTWLAHQAAWDLWRLEDRRTGLGVRRLAA